MSAQKIKAYFNRQASSWDKHAQHDSATLQKIIQICDLHPKQRVLDVACGTGVLFPLLLKENPSYLLGVDICEAMAARARSKFIDERLTVIAEDFYKLDETGFDCVIFYNAYPHFFDKAKLAQKTHDVLGTGGRFVLAHGRGKAHINALHKQRKVDELSVPLGSAEIERRWFEPLFHIDEVIDTNELYVISGTKA